MTSIELPRTCGLAGFAKEAAKAGYTNPDGSVNLLEAKFVSKKFGKLVAKSELDSATIKELGDAMQKIRERCNLSNDKFERSSK